MFSTIALKLMSDQSTQDLEIRFCNDDQVPADYLRLKREIYQNEKNYLSDERMQIDEERGGTHIVVIDRSSQNVVAHVQVQRTEESEFGRNYQWGASLKNSVMLTRGMVDQKFRGKGLFATIMYLALSVARQWKRGQMVCLVEGGEIPAKQILRYEAILHAEKLEIKGTGEKTQSLVPCRQFLENALEYSWQAIPHAVQIQIKSQLAEQVELFLENRLAKFMQGPWFQQIYSIQLTRDQYIVSLANMYQFVRLTTRILGQAVSVTSDPKLRRHFIDHLTGEVDHEVMIEADLKHLRADVGFVKNVMVPNAATQKFMVIQESMLAFYRDPVRYLAVPFAIEGFSAHLDRHFISCLEQCVARYGFNPKRATTFLSSHIETDGGDDGHWAKNVEIIRFVLNSESALKGFLNIVDMTIDAMEDCYTSYVNGFNLDQLRLPVADLQGQASDNLSINLEREVSAQAT